MDEHSSRIPGYKEDARLNIELVVPIQIPLMVRRVIAKKSWKQSETNSLNLVEERMMVEHRFT